MLLALQVKCDSMINVMAERTQLSTPAGLTKLSCTSCSREDCNFTRMSCRNSTYGEYFPSMNHFPLSIERLCHAGFYWCPSSAYFDRTVCAFCGIALHSWSHTDDPIVEHLRYNTACKLMESYNHKIDTLMSTILDGFPSNLIRPTVLRGAKANCVSLDDDEKQESLHQKIRNAPFLSALHAFYGSGSFVNANEIRIPSYQILHVQRKMEDQSRPCPIIRGYWWSQPGSGGSFRGLKLCNLFPSQCYKFKKAKDSAMKATVSVWGHPWMFQDCSILSAGEIAMICSHGGGAHIRKCKVGGIGGGEYEKASTGLYLMQDSQVLSWKTNFTHCTLFALRILHRGRIYCDTCSIRWTERGIGIEDAALVTLRSCELRQNSDSVFQAVSGAAQAKLHMIGCVILHASDIWFGRVRPGETIEREGVASSPSITYFTESISGPSYSENQKLKRPRVGSPFIPGKDIPIVTDEEREWAMRRPSDMAKGEMMK